MLTPEREKEIRKATQIAKEFPEASHIGKPEFTLKPEIAEELLAEIDRLRVWSSESHVTDLEAKLDLAVKALEQWQNYYEMGRAPYDQGPNPASEALKQIRGEK